MHVKQTEKIWDEITGNITALFAERNKHAADWYAYGLSQQEFDTICWDDVYPPDVRAKVNELGSEFFEGYKQVDARIGTVTYKLNTLNGSDWLMPSKWHTYYDSGKRTVTDKRILHIAEQRRVKMAEIARQQQEFKTTVKKLWDSANSVNDFVKRWPPGRDLLSSETRQRLDKKVERSSSSKETADDSVLQSTVAALNVEIFKAKVAA